MWDVVIENADEGIDELRSSSSSINASTEPRFLLPDNVENLTLIEAARQGVGNALANVMVGNSLDNAMSGLSGGDSLFGLAGNDYLTGGEGEDRIDGGAGADRMFGGPGNDIYLVDNPADKVNEYDFNVVEPDSGDDLVYSTVSFRLSEYIENLTLTGTADINGYGNSLNNILVGNSEPNRLIGLDGNDRLEGGAGLDRLYGGSGSDTYIVRDSTDYAYENQDAGIDTVFSFVTHRLRSNIEELRLTGDADINGYGNDLDNLIAGNSGSNRLGGLEGNDRLDGGDESDILVGGDGNDILIGGQSMDRLRGGTGADRFVFRDSDGTAADRIYDFSQADRDIVDLTLIDAITGTPSDDALTFIGSNAYHHVSGELRYEHVGTSTLVEGDLNGDGITDFLVQLDGVSTLTSDDFLL